jgi:bifunctional DNase/RNase
MPKQRKKDGSEWVAFGIVFLIALGIVWLALNYPVGQAAFATSGAQASYFAPTEELREQNVLRVDGTTITIGRGCTAIVADTSSERAEAITTALENRTSERPSAWDGWASSLTAFNITLEAVTMWGKNDDAYLSNAIFRSGSNVLELDMRPSDAIALALRTGTPIYLNMTLLREVGRNIC